MLCCAVFVHFIVHNLITSHFRHTPPPTTIHSLTCPPPSLCSILPLLRLHPLRRIRRKSLTLHIRPIRTQTRAATLLHTLHHRLFRIIIRVLEQFLEEIVWIAGFLLAVFVAYLVPIFGAVARGCWVRGAAGFGLLGCGWVEDFGGDGVGGCGSGGEGRWNWFGRVGAGGPF